MKTALATLLALFLAGPALAHSGPGAHGSLWAGLTHPMLGPDHLLAMVALGLWAATQTGRLVWMPPVGFVGGMVAGYLLALAGLTVPMVEPMILASVIVTGGLVALALRPGAVPALVLAGLFGAVHGMAHGSELGNAGVLAFGTGFVLSTAILHAAGLMIARGVAGNTPLRARLVPALGGITAAAGLAMALG